MKTYTEGARDAVAEARTHLGYREGPRNNENLFGEHYGWDFVPWCVQFAWYAGDVTGSSGGIPKTASTGAAMSWARSVGRWRTVPQPGDWSIMVNSKGATIHTDLVEAYDPRKKILACIGGNTSGVFEGSVNEGNGVYRNNRWGRWKDGRIVGFVRPLYGISRDELMVVQQAGGVKPDGVYGPKTRAAVVALQRRLGVKPDGYPGPGTYRMVVGTGAPVQVRASRAAGASRPAVAQPVPKAPPFPLPAGFYYGPASGPKQSVSGRSRNTAVPADVVESGGRWYSKGLKQWQAQMQSRGWSIKPDGRYGDQTEKVTRQFQRNKGLTQDGKIGPSTWTRAYTEPVR